MTCEEFEELSGAYALGAVTSEERQAARAHLATCVKCTRLNQQMRAIVDMLPLSVTQITPPAALKERVLAAMRREGQVIPIERNSQTRQRRRKPGWGTRLLAVAAIVLLLLAGGMTVWNVSLHQQVTTLQQQNTHLGSQVVQVYSIQGNDHAQTASGTLIYIPQQKITLLVLYGLPQLAGSQLYQGWLIHANQPTSIGMLTIQNGVASLTFPGTISGYEGAAISREPGPYPSKNAPKGPIVATGALQHPTQTLYTT
jgi:anti-sigma-K factor RskA